jgi:hypothetical protein
MLKLPRRLSYANVMATVAVFLALGGTGYAAITITGKNVKNGSLTGVDIKNSSLNTRDVKNGSLLANDFKAGQIPAGPRGPAGEQGPKGDTGPAGQPGKDGAPGASSQIIAQISPPSDGDPGASPDLTLGEVTADFPAARTYRVEYSGMYGGSCSASPCDFSIGVYVDGQPVSNSRVDMSMSFGSITFPCESLSTEPVDRLVDVPAGTHSVKIGSRTTATPA